MQKKKQPLRMCIGCGEMKPKTELLRIVKQKNGSIVCDATGKAQGRGAYICAGKECLEKAKKARRFERAFSQQLPEGFYVELETEFEGRV